MSSQESKNYLVSSGSGQIFKLLNLSGQEPAQRQYIDDLVNGLAENTRRAYLSAYRSYQRSDGAFPAQPADITQYLHQACIWLRDEQQHYVASPEPLSTAALELHLAALSFFHRIAGFDDPTQSIIVETAMKRIRRERGQAQALARPLTQQYLLTICQHLRHGHYRGRPAKSPMQLIDYRDMALLLIGFTGAFRRSELAVLEWQHIRFDVDWVILKLERSKTDQTGAGFSKLIYRSSAGSGICPVKALEDWQQAAGEKSGKVFRAIKPDRVTTGQALSGGQIDRIIKKLAQRAGIPDLPDDGIENIRPQFSGHSLRAGFVTTCARLGVPEHQIRKMTGHKTDRMIQHYTRSEQLAADNPTAGLW